MSRARFVPIAAALTAATIALVGCGESTSESTDSAKAPGPLAEITVKGDPGKEPTVTVAPKPLKVTKEEKRVVTEGEGTPLGKTDLASVHVQVINGTDGKLATSTWTQKQTLGVDLSSKQMLPILINQLPGAKQGARLLLAAPTKDVWGPEGNSDLNLKPDDTALLVVDVVKGGTSLKEAEGTAVAPKPELPTVKWNPGKAATITMPKSKPPTKLVTQPLIQGKGPKVESGQTIRVSYTGALWRNGQVFDSNAEGFTTPIGVGQVVAGWDKSIVGQPVGSRLLLIIPPADGYGSTGQGDIKGDDTMVFVVDILAAV